MWYLLLGRGTWKNEMDSTQLIKNSNVCNDIHCCLNIATLHIHACYNTTLPPLKKKGKYKDMPTINNKVPKCQTVGL